MKWAIGLVAALAVAGCGASDADKALAAKCVPNADKLLSLTFAAFDQDPSGGWRSLEAQAGCEGAIADLIARYRKRKPDEAKALEWREAQLRAAAGQTDRAIKLLQHQAELAGAGDPSPYGMADTYYREATIAFLQNDRPALEAARGRLAAVPEPPGFAQARVKLKAKFPKAAPAPWPINLDAVDGLIACFGKPYKLAYGAECRPASQDGSSQRQADARRAGR
jgi:hypothetical protein